jgi:hypothetical protein
MHRLVMQTTVSFFVFVGLVGFAMLLGRQQPSSVDMTMLRLADCAPPCWIGITPGKTSIPSAINRIREVYNKKSGFEVALAQDHPFYTMYGISVRSLSTPVSGLSIKWWYTGTVLSSIQFDLVHSSSDEPTLAHVLTAFGPPEFVEVADQRRLVQRGNTSSWKLVLHYNAPCIKAIFWTDLRLELHQKADDIQFSDSCPAPSSYSADDSFHSWKGMTSVLEYIGSP